MNVLPLLEGLQVVGSCWIGWNFDEFLLVETGEWLDWMDWMVSTGLDGILDWLEILEFQETQMPLVVFIFGSYMFLLFPILSCRSKSFCL